jgi:hypothetical protein
MLSIPTLAIPILASFKDQYSILYTHKLQLYILETIIFQKSKWGHYVLYITRPHPLPKVPPLQRIIFNVTYDYVN